MHKVGCTANGMIIRRNARLSYIIRAMYTHPRPFNFKIHILSLVLSHGFTLRKVDMCGQCAQVQRFAWDARGGSDYCVIDRAERT